MNKEILPAALPVEEYIRDGVKLLLVLDFDGVLNPDDVSGTFKKAYFNPDRNLRVPNPARDFPLPFHARVPKTLLVRYSSALIFALNDIALRADVQVLWATTWRADVARALGGMGIRSARPMAYIPFGPPDAVPSQDDKIPAIPSYLRGAMNAGLPLAWVDDEVLRDSPSYVLSPLTGRPPASLDHTVGSISDWTDADPNKLMNIGDGGTSWVLGNALLVAPQSRYGISRSELGLMKDFVNFHTER